VKELFLIERWEGHVAIVDIVDVVVKLGDKECNVLQEGFGGMADYTRNMSTDNTFLNKHD
jgi:hypothetical protein